MNPKRSFKSDENRAASSLWIAGHRYTRILCASKLKWVESNLKLQNLEFEVVLIRLEMVQRVAYR